MFNNVISYSLRKLGLSYGIRIVYITDWEQHLLVINLKGSIHYFIKNTWYKYTGTVHSKCINDHTLRSDIFLPKCQTHSREMSDKFESTLSKSDYLVGHHGRTWEWIFKDFFLHFSRWTCQTFCDRWCIFVSVLSFRYVECPVT